jgi:hypothetical protein
VNCEHVKCQTHTLDLLFDGKNYHRSIKYISTSILQEHWEGEEGRGGRRQERKGKKGVGVGGIGVGAGAFLFRKFLDCIDV